MNGAWTDFPDYKADTERIAEEVLDIVYAYDPGPRTVRAITGMVVEKACNHRPAADLLSPTGFAHFCARSVGIVVARHATMHERELARR